MSSKSFNYFYSFFNRDVGRFKSCVSQEADKKGISKDEVITMMNSEFKGIIKKAFKKAARRKMTLKPYQKLAVEYMATHRGMVAAFDVGTGKTLTAVVTADVVNSMAKLQGEKRFKIVIITPKSLIENFKKEMTVYHRKKIPKNYHFFTIQKFYRESLAGRFDCDKTLLIIDEAHNIRTAAKKSKQNREVMNCALSSYKVLLLTATPIYNNVDDIKNLAEMVKGEEPTKNKRFTIMRQLLRDENAFRNDYKGIFLFQSSDTSNYPSREDILYEIIMDTDYELKYQQIEDAATTSSKLFEDDDKNMSMAFASSLRMAVNEAIDDCIKCEPVMKLIREGEKTLVFSQFISKGVKVLMKTFEKEGITYDSITGDMSIVKRKKVVEEYNSNKIQVILISKAGGEGLDLKGTRKVILFDKVWGQSAEEQVVGRAIRYGSHSHLPANERNVKVYHIMVVKSRAAYFDMYLPIVKDYLKDFKKQYFNEIYIGGSRSKVIEEMSQEDYNHYTSTHIIISFGADIYMLRNQAKKEPEKQQVLDVLKSIQITKKDLKVKMPKQNNYVLKFKKP